MVGLIRRAWRAYLALLVSDEDTPEDELFWQAW